MKLILLQLILCVLLIESAFSPSNYPNSKEISTVPDQYTIYWRIEDDQIYLALKVQTEGWVGFGLSEPTSGSMPGSDIVTGYVDDETGAVHIFDRHSVAFAEPILDDCQDWGLVAGEQSGGYTILEIVRKLESEDSHDRNFHIHDVRIIWAFGYSDTFAYHTQRRATSVTFWGKSPILDLDFLIADDPLGAKYAFTQEDYPIPATRTHYGNKVIDLRPYFSNVSIHIIGINYIIDEDTVANVHHFVLTGVYEDSSYEDIWEWAPGVAPLIMPENVGYRAGLGGYLYLVLQTHYDNPNLRDDLVDSSGLMIYYTGALREYDAGVLVLADAFVRETTPISSGIGYQSFEYSCPSECTNMWNHSINVFSSFLHMHSSGSQIYTTHWRGEEFLGITNRIDYWDSNFQQQTPVSFVIQPGDRLNTHCVYRRLSTDVPFGQGSDQEMCMDFISYWPKIPNNFACGLSSKPDNVWCSGADHPFPVVNDPPFDPPYAVFGTEHPDGHECVPNEYIQSITPEQTEETEESEPTVVNIATSVIGDSSDPDDIQDDSTTIALFAVTVLIFVLF